jgi:hypothetical protein
MTTCLPLSSHRLVRNSAYVCVPIAYVHLSLQPPPMKLTADRAAAETWVYPLNRPKRDYQFNIVRTCLFDNTLVALPTGLGKTFIAGSVMLNCMFPITYMLPGADHPPPVYRWFPSGKVVFVAPSKPLVAQQIEACHQTCGIPGSDAVELTGEVSSKKRIEAVSLSTPILYTDFMFPCTVGGETSFLHDTTNPYE